MAFTQAFHWVVNGTVSKCGFSKGARGRIDRQTEDHHSIGHCLVDIIVRTTMQERRCYMYYRHHHVLMEQPYRAIISVADPITSER